LLQAKEVTKKYKTPAGTLAILSGVDLSLSRGDSAAVMGPSGTGKSTLLYILGALDQPTSGIVLVDGVNPHILSQDQAAAFRNRKVGFVFQDHCLLPQCSVLENVLVPALVHGCDAATIAHAKKLLDRVGLAARLDHRPAELSGGEKQRAAIARALLHRPALILCDEPTGNLDRASADSVAGLLLELQAEHKSVLVVVTHSLELASRFAKRFELIDGRLVETSPPVHVRERSH
jgi:lipoprotein-releasing system ATP-binding protein